MSVIIRPQSLALAGIPRTSPASQPGQPMKLIIPGMNKPNRVFNGVMMCGDCGRPRASLLQLARYRIYVIWAERPSPLLVGMPSVMFARIGVMRV